MDEPTSSTQQQGHQPQLLRYLMLYIDVGDPDAQPVGLIRRFFDASGAWVSTEALRRDGHWRSSRLDSSESSFDEVEITREEAELFRADLLERLGLPFEPEPALPPHPQPEPLAPAELAATVPLQPTSPEPPARTPTAELPEPLFDVVVLGGGPAGLTAASSLARAGRSVLVFDDATPRTSAGRLHGYLGLEGISPARLAQKGRAEAISFGAQVSSFSARAIEALPTAPESQPQPQPQPQQDQEARASAPDTAADTAPDTAPVPDAGSLSELAPAPLDLPDPLPPRFRVLSEGAPVRARTLLIATGVHDELPALPALSERWGIDVLHAHHLERPQLINRALALLALTPLGPSRALELHADLRPLTLITSATAGAPTDAELDALADAGIHHLSGELRSLALDPLSGALRGLSLDSGEFIELDLLMLLPHSHARLAPLEGLDLPTREQYLHGTPLGTALEPGPDGLLAPGIWAAGSVADLLAPAAAAVASAHQVAHSIDAALHAADALPNQATRPLLTS